MARLLNLLDLLFPPRCALCGKETDTEYGLCGGCDAEIQYRPLLQTLSVPGGTKVSCVSALEYAGITRNAVLSFKLKGKRRLESYFAKFMTLALEKTLPEAAFDAVAFIPMHKSTRKSRPYNQSEVLAAELAKMLDIPLWRGVSLVRQIDKQHTLSREQRIQNVRGAYAAKDGIAGTRVLLVDDIVTTGSTLAQASGALLASGAANVVCIAAAAPLSN